MTEPSQESTILISDPTKEPESPIPNSEWQIDTPNEAKGILTAPHTPQKAGGGGLKNVTGEASAPPLEAPMTPECMEKHERTAMELIGDRDLLQHTLDFYGAGDVKHGDKWTQFLAEHIILLAQAKKKKLDPTVALNVARKEATNYLDIRKAEIEEKLRNRTREEIVADRKVARRAKRRLAKGGGSVNGELWIPPPETSPAVTPVTIPSKTPQKSVTDGGKAASPPKTMRQAGDFDNRSENWKLSGRDDFIKELKVPKRMEEDFRQQREKCFNAIYFPGRPWPLEPPPKPAQPARRRRTKRTYNYMSYKVPYAMANMSIDEPLFTPNISTKTTPNAIEETPSTNNAAETPDIEQSITIEQNQPEFSCKEETDNVANLALMHEHLLHTEGISLHRERHLASPLEEFDDDFIFSYLHGRQ